MNCPYCLTKLQETQVLINSDPFKIFECFNCGGHWFPPLIANEITSNQASDIDAILPKNNITTFGQPRCPICQTRLALITHDPVPNGIRVWTCPEGHGHFFPNHQLIQFKKAQEAKITYHSLWGIPIKSLVSVMLPVIAVLALAGGLPLTIQRLQDNQETRTKASSSYTTPLVTKLSDSSVLISFSTTSPKSSFLSLYEKDKFVTTKQISVASVSHHRITLTDLSNQSNYSFTITITDPANNTSLTTSHYPINLK